MRYLWTYCSLLLFCMYVFACNKGDNKSDNIDTNSLNEIILEPASTLEFELDSVTSSYSRNIQYFDSDSIELLLYQNESQNEVIFFDFKKLSQIKKIKFEDEGPASIGKIAGFHMINFDSLVVAGNNINQLNFFRLDGSLINKLEFKIESNQRDLFPVIDPTLPYLVNEDTIIVPVRPEGLWGQIKDFSKEPVAALLDKNTGAYIMSDVTYPKDYYKNGFCQPIFARVKLDDAYVYSFYNNSDLFKTSNHKTFQKVSTKSRYINKLYGMTTPEPTMEEYLTWLSESPAYLGLLHDPYRKLIYRFVKLQYEVKKVDNLHQTNRFPVKLALMIYDENLNLLGEQKLEEGRYFWKNSFVGREGLYVNTSTPFNGDYNSESLRFELFKIKKK